VAAGPTCRIIVFPADGFVPLSLEPLTWDFWMVGRTASQLPSSARPLQLSFDCFQTPAHSFGGGSQLALCYEYVTSCNWTKGQYALDNSTRNLMLAARTSQGRQAGARSTGSGIFTLNVTPCSSPGTESGATSQICFSRAAAQVEVTHGNNKLSRRQAVVVLHRVVALLVTEWSASYRATATSESTTGSCQPPSSS
jgi:hypothetical protein